MLGCERDPAKTEPIDPFDPDAPALFDFSEDFTVELVDAGAEPRERLCYGERAPSRRVAMASSNPDNRHDKSPMMTLIVSWSSVEAEGDTRRYVYEVVDVVDRPTRKPNDFTAAYRQLAGQARGSEAGLERVIQTRGISASPNPATYIQMFTVPLPSEAIGVGAVWTRTHTIRTEWRIRGSSERPVDVSTETRRYTLVAREGDTLTLDYAMTQTPEEPQATHGASGSGRLVVDLRDPLPHTVEVDVTVVNSFPATADYPAGTDSMWWRHSIRTLE